MRRGAGRGAPRAAESPLAEAGRARSWGARQGIRFGLSPPATSEPQAPLLSTPPQLRKPLNYSPSSQSPPSRLPRRRSCIIHNMTSFLGHRSPAEQTLHPKPHPLANEESLWVEGRSANTRLGNAPVLAVPTLRALPPQQLGKNQGPGQRSPGRRKMTECLLKTQLSSWQCVTSRHFKCP